MERTATAVWNGTLKEGKGSNLDRRAACFRKRRIPSSRALKTAKGTNPEELIAAAHAGCFTMALSAQLGTMNFTPESLRTIATVTLEKLDAGWTISKIHLDVAAKFPAFRPRRLKRPQQAQKRIAPSRAC